MSQGYFVHSERSFQNYAEQQYQHGEIKIVEYSANVMESLLYFLLFDEKNLMASKNKITVDLVLAADYIL